MGYWKSKIWVILKIPLALSCSWIHFFAFLLKRGNTEISEAFSMTPFPPLPLQVLHFVHKELKFNQQTTCTVKTKTPYIKKGISGKHVFHVYKRQVHRLPIYSSSFLMEDKRQTENIKSPELSPAKPRDSFDHWYALHRRRTWNRISYWYLESILQDHTLVTTARPWADPL